MGVDQALIFLITNVTMNSWTLINRIIILTRRERGYLLQDVLSLEGVEVETLDSWGERIFLDYSFENFITMYLIALYVLLCYFLLDASFRRMVMQAIREAERRAGDGDEQ